MDFVSVIVIIVNILLAVKLAVGTTPILVWWERRVAGLFKIEQDQTDATLVDLDGWTNSKCSRYDEAYL